MTMAVRFTATAIDCGDGAAAQITQLQDLIQNAGALLFEGGQGLGQKAPPILTYTYVRIISPKREIANSLFVSRAPSGGTPNMRVYCACYDERSCPLSPR